LLMAVAALLTVIVSWRKGGAEASEIYQRLRREAAKDLEEALDKIEAQRQEILTLKQQVDILLAKDNQKRTEIDMLKTGYVTIAAKNRQLQAYVKLCIEEIKRMGGEVPEMPPLEIDGNVGKETK
jgi:chromosome segregation ATPase